MPITEVNLYKSGWLELVFDDRNKNYGAYDLRKHYADNLTKALVITVSGFVLLLLGYNYFLTHRATPDIKVDVVLRPKVFNEAIKKPPVTPPKPPKVDPPKVSTVKFPPPVVTIDELAKNPPKVDEIKGAVVGQTTVKGTTTEGPVDPPVDPPAKDVTEDNTPKLFGTIEVNPEYPGGEAAWTKFLQKNLKFPPQAADAGVSGKVFVSFVVEKDGHLSDIKVLRSAGYGFDEEAVRVLKLVPPWKPGIQNGRPVRVMYNMPFNFQLPKDDN